MKIQLLPSPFSPFLTLSLLAFLICYGKKENNLALPSIYFHHQLPKLILTVLTFSSSTSYNLAEDFPTQVLFSPLQIAPLSAGSFPLKYKRLLPAHLNKSNNKWQNINRNKINPSFDPTSVFYICTIFQPSFKADPVEIVLVIKMSPILHFHSPLIWLESFFCPKLHWSYFCQNPVTFMWSVTRLFYSCWLSEMLNMAWLCFSPCCIFFCFQGTPLHSWFSYYHISWWF